MWTSCLLVACPSEVRGTKEGNQIVKELQDWSYLKSETFGTNG